jgi:hypothetical protein
MGTGFRLIVHADLRSLIVSGTITNAHFYFHAARSGQSASEPGVPLTDSD